MANYVRKFPGGSKGAVNRAGRRIALGEAMPDDGLILDEWREAHRSVLNSFQAILRNRTRNTEITVGQRHKRRATIIDKLLRFPDMQLARMDDVAGCRLIFPDLGALHHFRDKLHSAHFKHELKNTADKYDYIQHPKTSGYRGIHDVYAYDVNSESGRDLKGLLIELQYRTVYQHAWATTVEVVGNITENQPKFERGDERFQHLLRLASEIISRAFEDMRGSLPDMHDGELVHEFVDLDAKLHFLEMLKGLNATNREISEDKNVILIFSEEEDLQILTFRDAPEAIRRLFELENENPERDVVLVRGESSADVREAFKNYFSDAADFIGLIEEGCQRLMKAKDYDEEFPVVEILDPATKKWLWAKDDEITFDEGEE